MYEASGDFASGPSNGRPALDPLLEQRDLLGRQRIAFQRHPLLHVGRSDPPKRLAAFEVLRDKSLLRRIARSRQPLERIDAITAFRLLRPVASQAVIQQHRRNIALEAEVIGGAIAPAFNAKRKAPQRRKGTHQSAPLRLCALCVSVLNPSHSILQSAFIRVIRSRFC